MSLVKERDIWKEGFISGNKTSFKVFLDYKENRNSEFFRLNRGLEEFFEYVLYLEEKQNDS